jgi:hypothetical protein
MSADRSRPPSPEDIRLYRIEQLELQLAQLRLELHDEYLDRSQMMNEYVPRAEHLRHAQQRREWPVIAATVAMAVTSLANILILALR